jgi:UDP-glucose 4-epimerase
MSVQSVAVTGGNGGLGRAVVEDLAGCAQITAIDIKPGAPGVRSRYADILQPEALTAAMAGHEAVVHVAAMLQPQAPSDRMFRTNVIGTWNVLRAAEALGIRKVVIISSECASGIINIDRTPQICPDYLPIDEAHPLHPLETYGLSKQINEITAQAFARRGRMQIVALRPTLILMPGMEDFAARTHESDDPDLWSYVELADVVKAIRLALDYDGPAYDCFYLSARDTYAREETLAFMERKFGRLPPIRDRKLYDDNAHASIWDISRMTQVLGVEPVSDWRQFIQRRKATHANV